jgi:hypothetical protein
LTTEYQRVCNTLKRLRYEADSVLAIWAIFENSNGYPNGDRRKALRDLVNKNYETVGLDRIQKLVVRDTILSIHRMIDHSDNGRKASVQSLVQVKQFLNQRDCIELLVSKARNWNPGFGLEDYNEKLVRSLYNEVMPRLRENKNIRNVGTIRKVMADLRNFTLAHALEREVLNQPRLLDIRDGLVLTSVLIMKCSLLIEGTNWDPKYRWKESLKDAQQFWDRFEKGLNV